MDAFLTHISWVRINIHNPTGVYKAETGWMEIFLLFEGPPWLHKNSSTHLGSSGSLLITIINKK